MTTYSVTVRMRTLPTDVRRDWLEQYLAGVLTGEGYEVESVMAVPVVEPAAEPQLDASQSGMEMGRF